MTGTGHESFPRTDVPEPSRRSPPDLRSDGDSVRGHCSNGTAVLPMRPGQSRLSWLVRDLRPRVSPAPNSQGGQILAHLNVDIESKGLVAFGMEDERLTP